MGWFGFILIRSLCFLNLFDLFLHQVRKDSCCYFFKQISFPPSVSFSCTPLMRIFLYFMFSQSSVKHSHSFFLAALIGCVFLLVFQIAVDPYSIHPTVYFSQCIFLYQIWYSLILTCYFYVLVLTTFLEHQYNHYHELYI